MATGINYHHPFPWEPMVLVQVGTSRIYRQLAPRVLQSTGGWRYR